jgi:hypothetical protein
MKSNDYHDYVIKEGEFIGRFEEMYQNCNDPWPETEDELNVLSPSLKTKQIVKDEKFKHILSAGTGKGLYLNWLRDNNQTKQFTGVEISKTCIEKCKKKYSFINLVHDNIADYLRYKNPQFDLIIFREIIWYILDDWYGICDILKSKHQGKHIIVELSFYHEQKYGAAYFNGPDEFINRFPFLIKEIVRQQQTNKTDESFVMIYAEI